MHIALGTANLGQQYGISNEHALTEIQAIKIIQTAFMRGITHFDTASDYGNSELLLQKSGVATSSNIQIKIPKSSGVDFETVLISIKKSLNNLGLERANSILFHNSEIYKHQDFRRTVESLVTLDITNHIGISCYTAKEAMEAYESCNLLTTFQVPENILDRRLSDSYEMNYLASEGCAIQVRSVFLQGLMLMKQDELPNKFRSCARQLAGLLLFAEQNNVSILQLCLAYATQIRWADSVVIGANSIEQLTEILDNANKRIVYDWDILEVIPEPLIDPRRW